MLLLLCSVCGCIDVLSEGRRATGPRGDAREEEGIDVSQWHCIFNIQTAGECAESLSGP